jgi:putative dehydrogenase
MTSATIAVFGLGSMGYGIATSALRGGLNVHGFDVAAAQVDKFLAEGGAPGPVSEVIPTVSAAMIVVLNAPQTEAVLFGDNGIVALLLPAPPSRPPLPVIWLTDVQNLVCITSTPRSLAGR